MERMQSAGTGNSRVAVSRATQVEMNNTPINPHDIDGFFNFIGAKDIRVVLSHLRPRKRWGTGYLRKRKIVLYRHSVQVFLHELGHVFNASPKDKHGPAFGRRVTDLYAKWFEFKNRLPSSQSVLPQPILFKFIGSKIEKAKAYLIEHGSASRDMLCKISGFDARNLHTALSIAMNSSRTKADKLFRTTYNPSTKTYTKEG